ncbi:MAG: hypothetical protein HW400_842 [Candidatus Levybacteria bacterium]|nr:hypothetical protein [Candidatus Levybacteria bacterium]
MKIALTVPEYGQVDLNPPGGVPTGGLEKGSAILQAFLNLALVLIILTSLYFLLQGGIDIIQSEGKKDKLNRGREKVIYAVFGLILVFAAFLTLSVASAVFGYDLLCIVFNPTSCK